MRWRWLIIIAMLVISVLLTLTLSLSALPNPYIVIRVQLSLLIGMTGVLFSLLTGVGLAIWQWRATTYKRLRQQAADERHRFIRRLDHELKNPLTAIMAGLANIATTDSRELRAPALESVSIQVQRLRQLVADLRKLSELETRKLDHAPVDLTTLFYNLHAAIQERPEAAERHLMLSLPSAPWPLPPIYGDGDLLFLAFYNLLDNAVKFTRPGDTIELRSYESNNAVMVEIADTGPGIPEAEMPLIWSELFRGEASRSIPGSGLGLALVKAILSRHSAQIELRSWVGRGTSIMIRLPVRRVAKR
jgi:two-component system OmpR family sensor kinase